LTYWHIKLLHGVLQLLLTWISYYCYITWTLNGNLQFS